MRRKSNSPGQKSIGEPDLTELHLRAENPAMMRDLFADARRDLRPRDWLERQLVDEICFARWRMLRLYVMEKAALDHASLDEQAPQEPDAAPDAFADHYWLARTFTSADQHSIFTALARLEARFHRQFMAAIRTFMHLRRSNPLHQHPAPRLDSIPLPSVHSLPPPPPEPRP